MRNWQEVIRTCNLSDDKKMDIISRWLILTRACVFSMTIVSALVGGLLAAATVARDPAVSFDGFSFALALFGVVLAHAANNMINDYFDLEGGVDTDEYARAQYAPHPILSGMISKAGLRRAIFVVNGIDVLIGVVLFARHGWPVVIFAALGLFISVFYVAPPLRLKHRGLGEPSVGLIWGPLMIGGTYFVTTGTLPFWAIVASLPYGLLVTTVLMGKHLDKYEADGERGIRTLPVVLGYLPARRLTQGMMVLFYVVIAVLVLTGDLGLWVLLVVLAIPQLIKTLAAFSQPKPDEPPPDYPVWPLWFVSIAFVHTRVAGFLLVLGLAFNVVIPVTLGG